MADVDFEQNIKPLFRERDRESMKFAFDLWSANWSCTVRASSSRMRSAAAGWFPRSRMWFPGKQSDWFPLARLTSPLGRTTVPD